MNDLLEVVLEDILRSEVCQLFMLLLSQADQIEQIQCSEPIKLFSEANVLGKQMEIFLNLAEDATLFAKLSNLNIAGYVIPSVLLRLVKYDEKFDIDFSFYESGVTDVGTAKLMEKLQRYIGDLAVQYDVGDWFGGMEPAFDEDTRYFTRGAQGLLS